MAVSLSTIDILLLVIAVVLLVGFICIFVWCVWWWSKRSRKPMRQIDTEKKEEEKLMKEVSSEKTSENPFSQYYVYRSNQLENRYDPQQENEP
jgi:heme/copper-type cytochrome/quinol oxidase subunit 1